MNPNKALATVIANSLKEALEAPRCDPQESDAMTEAAFIAIRALANEVRGGSKESEVGKWRCTYEELARTSKTRSAFLAKFAALTAALDPDSGASLERLCLHAACKSAWLAAHAETPRRFRLDALHEAGVATGALAMLTNPGELETRFRTNQAQKAANARHKDDRADRQHVSTWLQDNRANFKTDSERVDAIMEGKEVSAKRSTVARWVTEWNRTQKAKQTPPTT